MRDYTSALTLLLDTLKFAAGCLRLQTGLKHSSSPLSAKLEFQIAQDQSPQPKRPCIKGDVRIEVQEFHHVPLHVEELGSMQGDNSTQEKHCAFWIRAPSIEHQKVLSRKSKTAVQIDITRQI